MKEKHLLDRNEVAALIDPKITWEMVRKNEKRWGLLPFKVALNRRMIFYKRDGVVKALTERGFLDPK